MPGRNRTSRGAQSLCVLLLCAVPARAQKPGELVMPQSGHGRASAAANPSASANPCDSFDPVFRYGYANRRETAVAALLAGNDFAGSSRERALGMFMLSTRRDPSYVPAVFNLGVMSAKSSHWDDALKFYREATRLDTAHQFGAEIEAEVIRVDMIARLDSTPDGQRQRRFNIQLDDVIARYSDPAIALDRATRLIKADPVRWEAPAAAGTMQSLLGQYEDSAKSLDAATRLAPALWRARLTAAADLARQEGQYLQLSQEADSSAEKKQYENAARMYADAWQASPARVQTGMKAAVAFLMADQVPLAVQTLARVRLTGTPEISARATQMLNELGAISPDAKTAAAQPRSGESEQAIDVGERVRTTLGDLRSPEMKIATMPDPPLLSDTMKFIRVNDDQINNPASDLLLVSSQSLFSTYLQRACAPVPGQGPAQDAPPQPAPLMTFPVAEPTSPSPARPRLQERPDPTVSPAQPKPLAGADGSHPPPR